MSAAEGAEGSEAVAPVNPGNALGWIEIKPAEMPIPPDFNAWDTQETARPTSSGGTGPNRGKRTCAAADSIVSRSGRTAVSESKTSRRARTGLSISAGSTAGLSHQLTRNRLRGTIERDVEVPAIPGGHTDLPLDLGTMPLKLEVKN